MVVFSCVRARTGNEIGVIGAKAWAGLLLRSTTLTSVDLGCEWIVNALNCSLQIVKSFFVLFREQLRRRRRPSVGRRAQTKRVADEHSLAE